MIRVVLSGATGKVGRALLPALEAAVDLELVAATAPSLGLTLGEALATTQADVVVDFSTPEGAGAACRAAIESRVPLVLGTTGLPVADREQLDHAARDAGVPILQAPNFAVGAVLMMRFAEQARTLMSTCEIIEMHPDTKRDAPSGTALETARRLGGDVPIHSVRLPGLVAHQAVIFGGAGQTLTIRHDTTSREAFVPGVLVAIRQVGELPPGFTVGLESVL
jgi:4-hydroxy-tetrahydrodipicolinate reductase